MNKIEKLKLIEGEFSFNEAREILTSMFNSKINFHNIQNWSSQERYGKDDETAQKKIPLLKNEIEKLEEIILEAKAKNKKLVINSEIYISLKDN
jgi:hemerythrin superfamily protein